MAPNTFGAIPDGSEPGCFLDGYLDGWCEFFEECVFLNFSRCLASDLLAATLVSLASWKITKIWAKQPGFLAFSGPESVFLEMLAKPSNFLKIKFCNFLRFFKVANFFSKSCSAHQFHKRFARNFTRCSSGSSGCHKGAVQKV